MHWKRWRKHGDPLVGGRAESRRIIVGEPDDCWRFQGATNEGGYGHFSVNGREVRAHRIVYQDFIGPIPDGKEIDHRCRNRACCNPKHLRLVTNKQNGENRGSAQRNSRSGVRGVWWDERRQRWVAQVQHNGKQIRRSFDNFAEADAAAIAMRNELFTHNDADRPEKPCAP
jgi:hypothetical protein